MRRLLELAAGGGAAAASTSLARLDPGLVRVEAESMLVGLVDALWLRGWQPGELLRQLDRSGGAAWARLGRRLVTVDHRTREESSLDHRWVAQIEGLGLPGDEGTPGWLSRWAAGEGLAWPRELAVVVGVMAEIASLPDIDVLIDPPGSALGATAWASADSASDPVLERIRALLAKAERTEFEAEAVAFTAKAHELMTRHAIDQAAQAGADARADFVTVRLAVDAPYADAKALLLSQVAVAGRCRAVLMTSFDLVTLIGRADDLRAVEVLFTSLLVQAGAALDEAGRHAPPGSRPRSRAFRSSFLTGFALRVGQRLTEINEALAAEAAGSGALPVLASRSAALDELVAERYRLHTRRVGGARDPAGFTHGQHAGSVARLGSGHLPHRTM